MFKNNRIFSLVISKLMPAFSTVQLDVARNHIHPVFDFGFAFRQNLFASKASNSLLPLEAEEARSFESYSTSEIPIKYIYDAF